ncbi:hypothetical protein EJ08DRAFT_694687 [Tothia fuscella]|uniref:RNase H type-1 domain-containing protein n=1 Tax=Tothia fuscella TaxID=1048955 RepID=A0A9P4NY52_9PEZI|nr:hypothetical protein EJ08DRAFT_694687 [Tothia fuscella]
MHKRYKYEGHGRDNTIVIKTDSSYLVKGTPVVNKDLFKSLDRVVTWLDKMDVVVLFWHVRREFNGVADALANDGFDGGDRVWEALDGELDRRLDAVERWREEHPNWEAEADAMDRKLATKKRRVKS